MNNHAHALWGNYTQHLHCEEPSTWNPRVKRLSYFRSWSAIVSYHQYDPIHRSHHALFWAWGNSTSSYCPSADAHLHDVRTLVLVWKTAICPLGVNIAPLPLLLILPLPCWLVLRSMEKLVLFPGMLALRPIVPMLVPLSCTPARTLPEVVRSRKWCGSGSGDAVLSPAKWLAS